ncbi:MAG: HDIG domain-containing protein [Candidatus Omnitrophica bacterium]|nr:HDIG domain-containing protein [Candidatus Omnitrophota bacterium]
MKNIIGQIQDNTTKKNSLIVIIVIFLCLLLSLVFFLGKDFLWTAYYSEQGQISHRDIFSPFDFSFINKEGLEIKIKKNELILERGEKINKNHELATSELLKIQKQPKNLYYIFGILLLLIIFAVSIATYDAIHKSKILHKEKNVLLLCLLILLIILGTKAILFSAWSVYLIPLASVSMLVAILIDPGVALMLTVLLSIFLSVLTGGSFDVMVTMMSGGIVSIYSVLNMRRRRNLTKAGFLIGLTHMVSIVSMGLINFVSINNLIVQGAWGIANGMLSAIIVTGLLPIFEILFQITTNISLLELSDLNQPVLKELVLKAPGTYHHSLVVGNLAESAAEAVGANSLLARVGGYFHDIGKLRMAHYFSENQGHIENRHENLSPTISSLIIINHIKEGADLAKKYKLGKAINDIIVQHHGDDIVHFFYHRALELHGEEKNKIQAEDFRYPGPKPQSKEAAIVMLADSVEAASKAIAQPTPGKINELVSRIVNNKFIDGQLDGCDLTLKDLHTIAGVFTHILNGISHSRVEYPDIKQLQNEQNKNKESSEKKGKFARPKKTGE